VVFDRLCDGKVKDIYESKELWRGPESIYTLTQGLCVAHDRLNVVKGLKRTTQIVSLVRS
jgi:hypothetical protein